MERSVRVIVRPAGDTAWAVTLEGRRQPIAMASTKGEALSRARRELAYLKGGQLEVRNRDGSIEMSSSTGRRRSAESNAQG